MSEIEVKVGDIYLFFNEMKVIILNIIKSSSYNYYTSETTDKYDCINIYKDEIYKGNAYSDTIRNPKYYKKIGENFKTFEKLEDKDNDK